jgi:hypothetical protein
MIFWGYLFLKMPYIFYGNMIIWQYIPLFMWTVTLKSHHFWKGITFFWMIVPKLNTEMKFILFSHPPSIHDKSKQLLLTWVGCRHTALPMKNGKNLLENNPTKVATLTQEYILIYCYMHIEKVMRHKAWERKRIMTMWVCLSFPPT